MRLVIAAAIFATIPLSAVHAAGDVAAGRAIAETWCQPCHAIAAPTGSDVATPFSDIAAKRSALAIGAFLANPHGDMPNIQLSRKQIDDVIAYMETLKAR